MGTIQTEQNPYPTDCYAVPGEDSIIDCIHPATGLTVYCHETVEQIQVRYPGAVRMTIEEFCQQKALRQHTPVQWIAIDEERYFEMLEVLPPAYMGKGGFLVGEPTDHDASTGRPRYAAFIQRSDGRYYESSRPVTKAEFVHGEV